MKFTVYRYFDASGTPLYVGSTRNPRDREHHHKFSSPWWAQMEPSLTDITTHATFEEMVETERSEISALWPLHNKRGVTSSYIPPAPVLPKWVDPDAAARIDAELTALRQERDSLPSRIGEAIDRARTEGRSWREIGNALRVTHVAAINAHNRWKADHEGPSGRDPGADAERVRRYTRRR